MNTTEHKVNCSELGFNKEMYIAELDALDWLDAQGFALGQKRVDNAFSFFASPQCQGQHLFLLGHPGIDNKALVKELLNLHPLNLQQVQDTLYGEDVSDPRYPVCLQVPAGQGRKLLRLVTSWLKSHEPKQATAAASATKSTEQDSDDKTAQLPPTEEPPTEEPPTEQDGTATTEQPGEAKELSYQESVGTLLKVFKRQPKVVSYLTDLARQLDKGYKLSHPVLLNLLVNHHDNGQFPIVFCDNPDPSKLFGEISILTEQGSTVANHHLLQPGLLHIANGGVLVLPAERLLDAPEIWFELKTALFDAKLRWSNATSWLDPKHVPLSVQIIVLGDNHSYKELLHLDPDFLQLLPLVAEVDHQFPLDSPKQRAEYAGYLQNLARRASCHDLSHAALAHLTAYASRLVEHQHKASLDSSVLTHIIQQAQALSQGNEITDTAIIKALDSLEYRHNRIAELSFGAIREEQIKIDTQGQVVGQLNALSVLETDMDCFGEPSRITATVYIGEGEITDVERKVDLGGNLHAKGVLILTSYLHQLFSFHDPLPLSANLVFEQSYQGIDGDSASLASLLCLLSALSEVPIKQEVAVTGAIDQFGNVQSVGGINEKIEGFYRTCELQGLTQHQGVVIPHHNVVNLNLNQVICDQINNQAFSLYGISHIDQAIEILFGMPAGKADEDGHYPEKSLYGIIQQRLDKITMRHEEPEGFLSKIINLFN